MWWCKILYNSEYTPTNGGTTPTTLAYTYDKAKFNVVDNAAPTKQVRIEIADLDVQKNAYLQHSVQKIFKYIQDYQNGTITAEDLTNAGSQFKIRHQHFG